ncbi:coenzyme F420-0:L-glutamate ligase [Candidatus Bathyarchaeota archaeon]|nr:coenzyme F420-0:L-glutamate ligase [Candidatus Bathyarchaeota archaeon]
MSQLNPEVRIMGISGIKEIRKADDLGEIIFDAAESQGTSIIDKDIIVISQKIVSKSEGRICKLSKIKPSLFALRLGKRIDKDPAFVELVLRESRTIVRMSNHLIITKTRHGWLCANSGVDISNVSGGDSATLLPVNPDQSAKRIRKRIEDLSGKKIAVIISDTFGRPFRIGHTDIAIGCSGISPISDLRGTVDAYGYVMRVKQTAIIDELASAAELVIGNSSEGVPAAIIRGVTYTANEKAKARTLIMKEENNLFR